MNDQDNSEGMRIDKWLWAARFFKTRGVAAEAVGGGKVEINGERAKPSRLVRPGDRLSIRRGPYEWTVIVKNLAKLRGPASRAQALWEETEESLRRREAAAAQMNLERPGRFDSPGRPSKKDRRAMQRFTKRDW
ncbi:MAG: S4 domain-containing protein [Deltaproteobacteria bacterium]|nr:S4 domain-containing protein [Deltaproteobacteria bacterium]